MHSKVVAIWGSPGSGKTTLAIKIAKILAARKQNVIIVGCDNIVPFLPLVHPTGKDFQSLGSMLALPTLTETAIMQHCTPYISQYIALLGYKKNDNPLTYASYNQTKARDFIFKLRKIADYILIDCSSHLMSSPLSLTAIEMADEIVRVATPSIRSLLYFESMKKILEQKTEFRYGQHISVINDARSEQDVDLIMQLIGGVSAYILPNVPELLTQYDEGKIYDTVYGKSAKVFEMGLETMVQEVFSNES